MGSVEASVEIEASLADVWDLYFDPERWAAWVDGFEAPVSESGGYPERGGELVWRSNPAGRGQVRERVLAHEPRTLHRIAFEDPESSGELEVAFEMLPASTGTGEGPATGASGGGEAMTSARRTRVRQKLTYELRGGGPLRGVTDALFIRAQMRGSLQRSLEQLSREVTLAPDTSD